PPAAGDGGRGRAGDLGIAAADHALEGLTIEPLPDLLGGERVRNVEVVAAERLELAHHRLGRPPHRPRLGLGPRGDGDERRSDGEHERDRELRHDSPLDDVAGLDHTTSSTEPSFASRAAGEASAYGWTARRRDLAS